MQLGIIDVIVVIFLFLGAFLGLKRGIIKSVISFVGIVLALIIAWCLKNPISEFLYTTLPIFNFKSSTALVNIMIYEIIAFLVIAIILLIVVKLIMIFTGVVDKILSVTKILGFANKLLGLVFGFIEAYVIAFTVLFFLYNFTNFYHEIENNTLSYRIVESSPILSDLVKNESQSIDEIASIQSHYNEDSEEYSKELFNVLLKYKIIKPSTAEKLVKKGKINIPNAQDIINEYK